MSILWRLLAIATLAAVVACSSTSSSSYYYAQKQISNGDLTFHQSLRVDEYLNAFPQDWLEVPEDEQVVLRVAPMTASLPPVGENMLYQVALKTRDIAADEVLEQVALCLVVDVSGSMLGEKIEDTRAALKAAVMEMKQGDLVSLVVFQTQAKVLASNVTINAASRTNLLRTIDSLEAGGGTNIQHGLTVGYSQLAQFPEISARRLLLLTDGQSSVGVTSPVEIAAAAGVASVVDAKISTIGLGIDVDQALLRKIAEQGGGHYYFADNSKTLTRILREDLATTVKPLLANTTLDIELGEGLELVNLYGADSEAETGVIQAQLGTLHMNDWRIVIVEARVLDPEEAGVQARATYQLAGSNENRTLIARPASPAKPLDEQALRNAVLFGNARALVRVGELAEQREYADAKAILDLQINNNRLLGRYDVSEQVARELQNLQRVRERVVELEQGTGHTVSDGSATPEPLDPADGQEDVSLKQLVLTGLDLVSGTPPGTWVTITKLAGAALR